MPPLLLQPLVENAVKHGIAQLLEGGVVQIARARDGGHVRISVENRCDPDRPSRSAARTSASRTRAAAWRCSTGAMEIAEAPESFRVTLWICRMIKSR